MDKDSKIPPIPDDANGDWQDLVNYCMDRFKESEKSTYRAKKIAEIKESIKAYEQVSSETDDPWPGASNIVLPLTTISADNIEPRLVAGLIGKMPYVRFELENEQKQDEQTEIVEKWFNNELQDTVLIDRIAGQLTHKILQEGTVYPMPIYDLREEIRKDFILIEEAMQRIGPQQQALQQQVQKISMQAQQAAQGGETEIAQQLVMQARQMAAQAQAMTPKSIGGVVVDDNGNPQTKDITENIFEGGVVKFIPFTDVYIADDVDDWEQADVIFKYYPTYAELYRKKGQPGWIDDNIGAWLCKETGETSLSKEATAPNQEIDEVKLHGKKVVDCLSCCIRYIYKDKDQDEQDIEDYTEQRMVAVIAKEREVLLRLIPLREINFKSEHILKRIRLYPEQGKSYGSSIFAKIKALQEGASKTFNTAINVAEITMIPWFFYEKSAGLDRIEKLKSKQDGMKLSPGKGIPVDNAKGVVFPRFNINPDQMISWINIWVSFWERLISIGNLQMGLVSDEKRTATEAMASIQEGNIKHNYQAAPLKDDFLSIIRTIYDLYYQYMPLKKTFLWNGQQVPIPRAAMRRRYKFRLTGSTDFSNKLIERKEKEDFYNLTARDPNINPVKKSEELVKAYGHTDVGEWIMPNIKNIIDQLMQDPQKMKLVQQAFQQANQLAQEISGKGKPKSSQRQVQ